MSELLLTLEDVVLDDLAKRARLHGRTPSEEAKAILTEALTAETSQVWAPVDAIYRRLEALGKSYSDSADLIREDRDR